jgi:hypothetical protein
VLIGLQRRQVFRLLRGLKQDGATSLLSKRRGKPSNHRLPAEVRTLALSIVRDQYAELIAGTAVRENFSDRVLGFNLFGKTLRVDKRISERLRKLTNELR